MHKKNYRFSKLVKKYFHEEHTSPIKKPDGFPSGFFYGLIALFGSEITGDCAA